MFAVGFEEIAMSEKTVFSGDRVFEEWGFLWHESKGHVGAEEDEDANSGEVRGPVMKSWQVDEGKEGELSEDDGDDENRNVYRKDGFFGEAAIGIIDQGDEEGKDEKAYEFSGEVIWICAEEVAVD